MVDREVGGLAASLKAPAAVFRNPDLRRLEIGWGALSMATWAYAIALAVYAFDVGGATAVGLVALLRLLPGAAVAPFASLFGDLGSRRRLLVASAAGTALALAAAAAVTASDGAPALVYATAVVFAVVTSAYLPVQSALLPLAARSPRELTAANVAMTVMDNGGFLVGAIGAGVLLTVGSPELVFGLAAAIAAIAAIGLIRLTPDRRPDYVQVPRVAEVAGETLSGASTVVRDPHLRLLTAALTLLVFFEGVIDVLIVVVALDLLGLGEGSVGYLNAAWGIGAVLAGAALAMLIHRGRLALGIGAGSLAIGAAAALIAAWPETVSAYLGLAAIGAGYTLVEVAGKTFLQRLGSDEVLARVFGFLETTRLAATALGSIVAPVLIALLGTRGALIATGAMLPLFALVRWERLHAFETGTEVDWSHYNLLRENPIFQPLPVATLERICHDLTPVKVDDGTAIITQGEVGDRFYLILEGEVEVYEDGALRRVERDGESFGEIALMRNVPRTATVRASRTTTLLALDRDQFISAVTGYPRSRQQTDLVIRARLGDEGT